MDEDFLSAFANLLRVLVSSWQLRELLHKQRKDSEK
jgi:hypothetical protein